MSILTNHKVRGAGLSIKEIKNIDLPKIAALSISSKQNKQTAMKYRGYILKNFFL